MVLRKNNIFVDSNYFIALYNEEDTLFDKAQDISKSLIVENPLLVISNHIFSEVVTIISQRVGKSDAIEAGEYLRNSQHVKMVM